MRLDVDRLVTGLSFDRRRVHEIFGEAGFAPVSYHTTRTWAERDSIPVNRLLELLVAGRRRGGAVDLTAYRRQEGVNEDGRQRKDSVCPRCGQSVRAGAADSADSGRLAAAKLA